LSFGLQIRDASGNLRFDSTTAIGGVCLGIFLVPAGIQTLTFPLMVGRTGVALGTGAGGGLSYTTDNSLGYLRFTFNTVGSTNVVLFAK
jgi:hypothetical protein